MGLVAIGYYLGRKIYTTNRLVIIGAVALCGGGYLTIENVVLIAQGIGISETVIGITIVAIGTSLPELVTSITAIKKGHTDIGIGTIVGSNIYNILMIMGVSSVITGIAVVPGIFTDQIFGDDWLCCCPNCILKIRYNSQTCWNWYWQLRMQRILVTLYYFRFSF